MVEHAPFYIMILRSPHLTIEAFNPSYAKMFEGQTVVGRNFEDVLDLALPEMRALVDLVHAVYRENGPQSVTNVHTRLSEDEAAAQARYFTYTAVPLHDNAGKVDGVVIYGDEVPGPVADASHNGAGS
jgi:PAS domain-containing protein